MNSSATQPPSSSPASSTASTTSTSAATTSTAAGTPFDLHLHFAGPFVFSLKTDPSSPDKLTGVEIYGPACGGHTHAATINTGSSYMLESHWHCIHPAFASTTRPAPLTVSQLKTNVGANTPWVAANRPVKGGWEVAFSLPVPPDDWGCDLFVPVSKGTTFSGNDAGVIPTSVAIEHVLVYKQVLSTTQFQGACFPVTLTPVNGIVDIHITAENPDVIPTKQHERRAISAIAALLGLDLVLEVPLGPSSPPAGTFRSRNRSGGCSMGIISGPGI